MSPLMHLLPTYLFHDNIQLLLIFNSAKLPLQYVSNDLLSQISVIHLDLQYSKINSDQISTMRVTQN